MRPVRQEQKLVVCTAIAIGLLASYMDILKNEVNKSRTEGITAN